MQAAILTFIIPVISMIFTCAFGALWWQDRKQWPVLAFAVCFGSLALGVAINIWIFESVNPLGVVAYHVISMAGVLALMWGVAERAEVKAPIGFCAASVLIVSVMIWYAMAIGQPDAMRLIQNTNSAVVTTMIAVTLWHGARRNMADHALMWVVIALAAFGFIRPTLTILFDAVAGPDGTGAVIINAIHILVLATLLTLIALCLIASIVFGTLHSERERATTDPLSGLPNRAAFEEKVEAALEQARRENVPISLLVGDIDNFKAVNDTWGHSAGDKVIATLGKLLEGRVRPKDIAGRIGGEEFCVLVWNCREAGAVSLANRIRLAFSNAHIPGFTDERFTVSFGVVHFGQSEDYSQCFSRADQALYAAKRAGRNRVESASASSSNGATDAAHDRDNEDADENDSIVHLEGAHVVSFEKAKAAKPR